jgi:hypothetical protein
MVFRKNWSEFNIVRRVSDRGKLFAISLLMLDQVIDGFWAIPRRINP